MGVGICCGLKVPPTWDKYSVKNRMKWGFTEGNLIGSLGGGFWVGNKNGGILGRERLGRWVVGRDLGEMVGGFLCKRKQEWLLFWVIDVDNFLWGSGFLIGKGLGVGVVDKSVDK